MLQQAEKTMISLKPEQRQASTEMARQEGQKKEHQDEQDNEEHLCFTHSWRCCPIPVLYVGGFSGIDFVKNWHF